MPSRSTFSKFQSTRPCGARRATSYRLPANIKVSIHAPLRGATTYPRARGRRSGSFNPRAPAGRDGRPIRLTLQSSVFQSTRPCGARPAPSASPSPGYAFQSTRPCGARQGSGQYAAVDQSFNPRAPAGRDDRGRDELGRNLRFQSTRPCGARRNVYVVDWWSGQFQSTRPCGARHGAPTGSGEQDHVSIHAPLRGATDEHSAGPPTLNVFQSTRPCGARPAVCSTSTTSAKFQSTRPCGARPRCASRPTTSAGFNPRAPAGRDVENNHRVTTETVSIHAPLRGATHRRCRQRQKDAVSIHAPLRGATNLIAWHNPNLRGFNPRAPAGRDLDGGRRMRWIVWFQSTRPCGARLQFTAAVAPDKFVSIHAPLRGATARTP